MYQLIRTCVVGHKGHKSWIHTKYMEAGFMTIVAFRTATQLNSDFR